MKNKISDISTFILLVFVIFISKETLMFGSIDNRTIAFTRNMLMIGLCPASFLLLSRFKHAVVTLNQRFVLGSLSVLILLSGILGIGGLELAYFIKIMMLVTGVFISCLIPVDQFIRVYERLIVIIATCSIIFYFINFISPSIVKLFPVIFNMTGLGFYNMIVTTIPAFDYDRLFGPFREPGVYMVYLNLAIYLHITNHDVLNIRKLIVLITALILTKSTAGYIVLLAIIALYLIKNRNIKILNKLLVSVLMIIGFGGIYYYTDILAEDGDVFNKLDVVGSASTVSRLGSLIGNIEITKDYPLFGVGLNGIIELFPSYCKKATGFFSEFNTNTILMQFSIHGVFYGSLFCYYFFSFFAKNSWSIISIIISIMVGFLLFSSENLCDNFMLYIILGYGLINPHRCNYSGIGYAPSENRLK